MIRFHKQRCIGCEICEIICSIEHLEEINIKKSMIRYSEDSSQSKVMEFCRQCERRACIPACPEKALSLSHGEIVEIDRSLCTGCRDCSEACPFGSLPVDGRYPLYCDTCGGVYRCVQWCPVNALSKRGGE